MHPHHASSACPAVLCPLLFIRSGIAQHMNGQTDLGSFLTDVAAATAPLWDRLWRPDWMHAPLKG